MPNIVSKAEFAKLAGVAPASVTKALRKQLAGAVRANRIDANHPDAQAYLTSQNPSAHRKARSAPAPTSSLKPAQTAPSIPTLSPERSLADPIDPTAQRPPAPLQHQPATDAELAAFEAELKPIIEKWGTATLCTDWLAATKTVEVIRGQRLKNAVTEGKLIKRELVQAHVMGYLEAANRKLLTDAPKTGAVTVYGLCKSGASLEQAEGALRDVNGSHLEALKGKIAKTLRDA